MIVYELEVGFLTQKAHATYAVIRRLPYLLAHAQYPYLEH